MDGMTIAVLMGFWAMVGVIVAVWSRVLARIGWPVKWIAWHRYGLYLFAFVTSVVVLAAVGAKDKERESDPLNDAFWEKHGAELIQANVEQSLKR